MAWSKATQARSRSGLARASGLVTILALIVAPVCAPLCAARVCSEAAVPSASQAPCHLSGAMQGDALQVHSVENCSASESPAGVLSFSIKNDKLQANRQASIDDGLGALSKELSVYHSRPSGRCIEGPPLARSSAASLSIGVLRI